MDFKRPFAAPLIVALFAGWATAAGPTNEFCPVMPERRASAKFQLVHEGRAVAFCCAGCIDEFRADPPRYTARLTPAQQLASDESSGSALAAFRLAQRYWPLLAFGGAVTAVTAAARLARPRLTFSGTRLGIGRCLAVLGSPATAAAVILAGVVAQLRGELAEARREADRLRAEVGNATRRNAAAVNLGGWLWPLGLTRVPQGLRQTYYRGNDERDPQLFNGGDYRTATFRLVLQTADGEAVRPGDSVAGRSLVLRLDIERSPGTAEAFFTAVKMARVAAAHTADDVGRPDAPGRIPLTSVDSHHWYVVVPVGTVTGQGTENHVGRWHLCVDVIPHYTLHFGVLFEDGRVHPQSVVWMEAAYATPEAVGRGSRGWFSDEPIPEVTGRNSADSALLGLPGR